MARRRNIDELMLLENPGFNSFGMMNPRRRRRRNPVARSRSLALPSTMRGWTQGVDLMDAGAAVGGLAASTMIPGMIVKDATTIGGKLTKLAVSLGSALGAGALGKTMISPSAGKAAIIGGVAGTAAQALGMFTNIQIGEQSSTRRVIRRIGDTMEVSPASTREGERVSIIEP